MNGRIAFPKAPMILLGIMAAITALQEALPLQWYQTILEDLGCALFYQGTFYPERLYTVVTAIFVHAGWFHLIANGIWLILLGPTIHKTMGPFRFTVFFMLCGIVGNLAHAFINWGVYSLVIGASGSLFGLLGAAAYVVTRSRSGGPPHAKNVVHYVVVVLALLGGYALLSGDSGISWEAHLGGFAAGLALFPMMRRRDGGASEPPRDMHQA